MWTPAKREEMVEEAIRDYWERVEGSWRYPQKTLQERMNGYNNYYYKTHRTEDGTIKTELTENPNYDPKNPNGTPPDLSDEEYDSIYNAQQDDTSNECYDGDYNPHAYRPEGFENWSNSAKKKWIEKNSK